MVDLTRDFDLSLAGTVAKAVTLAAVSAPIVNPPPPTPDAAGVLPDSVGNTLSPSSTPSPVDPISPGRFSPDQAGELGATLQPADGGSGTGPGTSGGVGGEAAVGTRTAATTGGGSLPVTGYVVLISAGLGAAMASAGALARSALRHRRG